MRNIRFTNRHEFFDNLHAEDLLTVEEVAMVLTVAPKTIRKWRFQGDLRAVKIGRRLIRFRWGDVLEWLKTNGVNHVHP